MKMIFNKGYFCTSNPDTVRNYDTVLSLFVIQTEQEVQEDYENIGEELPPKPPYTYNFDSETDTSEDEVEVNYAHVNIKPKSGHQRDSSSSSSEDETQYSQVKI